MINASDFPVPAGGETFWRCRCKTECAISKARRLISKGRGDIRCAKCDGKSVTLRSGFSQWPTAEFKGLPEDAQTQVYKDVQKKRGA